MYYNFTQEKRKITFFITIWVTAKAVTCGFFMYKYKIEIYWSEADECFIAELPALN